MLRKMWVERPPTPVILAWATAGVLAVVILVLAGYGLYRFITLLTG